MCVPEKNGNPLKHIYRPYLSAANCSQRYEAAHSKSNKIILSDKSNASCYQITLALFTTHSRIWYKQTSNRRRIKRKKKKNFSITHSSDNGKCYFSLFIEQSNMAQRKIKVLYPDQQNKVLYENILIAQAFYCILRLRSVLHLCYHIHGHILQACYIFQIFTHSL